jgi:hypothetical protein
MPEISRFYGIKIRMHYGMDEHPPPHFHARSSSGNASIALDGTLLEGHLSAKELALVKQWVQLHQAELARNWELCTSDENPLKIAPLQ